MYSYTTNNNFSILFVFSIVLNNYINNFLWQLQKPLEDFSHVANIKNVSAVK